MTASDKIWIEPAWAETFARPDGDLITARHASITHQQKDASHDRTG